LILLFSSIRFSVGLFACPCVEGRVVCHRNNKRKRESLTRTKRQKGTEKKEIEVKEGNYTASYPFQVGVLSKSSDEKQKSLRLPVFLLWCEEMKENK